MDLHAYHRALNLGFSESEASRIGDDAWENNRQQPTCDPEPEPDYYDVLVAENTQLRAAITRLRAELAKADGQINRCVEQNKYLESTISRPQDQIALTPKPFCEEHSKFPYEECPWCEAEAQTALVSRLREYAGHKPECAHWDWVLEASRLRDSCDCGYDAMMADVEEGK